MLNKKEKLKRVRRLIKDIENSDRKEFIMTSIITSFHVFTEEFRREYLIDLAKQKSGNAICPVGDLKLKDCFIEYGEELYLWYNDITGKTHVVRERMNCE